MKTLKSLFILTLAVFMGISTAIAGNSDETQIRKVENFNAIKVSTGIDLYLTMGTSEEVKIVADDDIIEDLKTEVKDGTLHIYVKQNNWFNWGGNKTRKAYVTVTELVALHASSGSDVRSENTIKGTSLEVKASSGSDVVLDVFYKNLSVDTSSGSDAKITGRVKTLEAESSSGSDIKAEGLEAQIGKLKASSGSDITVTVTDELYARASSGSDIKYYGNPQIRDTDESSGGDVRHK
ncbi:head GIN domain-containing protein [uncultured Draconibacterium sp.]|uniref:head GIN domain-containing protein n=1 Tax=uncultured Draconibacterium sp. TaxID=1573823 RepID=UPI003216ACA4